MSAEPFHLTSNSRFGYSVCLMIHEGPATGRSWITILLAFLQQKPIQAVMHHASTTDTAREGGHHRRGTIRVLLVVAEAATDCTDTHARKALFKRIKTFWRDAEEV